MLVPGTGTPFQRSPDPLVIHDSRYRSIAGLVGALSGEPETNGLHIHMAIPDQECGVRALNSVRRRLPTLLAISANSPYLVRQRHRVRQLAGYPFKVLDDGEMPTLVC